MNDAENIVKVTRDHVKQDTK